MDVSVLRAGHPLRGRAALSLLVLILLGAGCVSSPPPEPVDLLAPTEEQMRIRNMQTRSFEVADRRQAIRGVIQALQDLGFIIERANEPLGVVTGARFAEPNFYDVVGVTVTVRDEGGRNMTIRANALFDNQPITDPEVYRNFFATLERSLFVGRSTGSDDSGPAPEAAEMATEESEP